jgi:hypothetical protein
LPDTTAELELLLLLLLWSLLERPAPAAVFAAFTIELV